MGHHFLLQSPPPWANNATCNQGLERVCLEIPMQLRSWKEFSINQNRHQQILFPLHSTSFKEKLPFANRTTRYEEKTRKEVLCIYQKTPKINHPKLQQQLCPQNDLPVLTHQGSLSSFFFLFLFDFLFQFSIISQLLVSLADFVFQFVVIRVAVMISLLRFAFHFTCIYMFD